MLKLFEIISGQVYLLDKFVNIVYFDIRLVTFLTNHSYELILKHDLEKIIQYTNGETIDIAYFQKFKHSNVSMTSNCNGILEITYKKIEYMGNPIFDTQTKFMKKCTQKYYDGLFKKKCVKGVNRFYFDRKTIANLRLHYHDIEFMNYFNEYMQNKNDYINISGRADVHAYGDVILGIEINAVEQTVCNISLHNDIFLSFNVKQGRHNYDIFTLTQNAFWKMNIWFNNDHVNVIKYKCINLPNVFKNTFTKGPMILHCDVYTPDLVYRDFYCYPMENISKAKNKGMRIVLCSMILALNDNKSNLQMLNHDILFNILCQLKALLF